MSVDYQEAQESHINQTLSNVDDFIVYFISRTCGPSSTSTNSHEAVIFNRASPSLDIHSSGVIKFDGCRIGALTTRLLLDLIWFN